jgi:dipeptidyl aminopeptidase/acylaminoacyl peptidase
LWLYNITDDREFEIALPEGIGQFLSLSSDGDKLLFYNPSYKYKMALKIVSISGGPSLEVGRELTLIPYFQYWSSDSKMIVTREDKKGSNSDLWILPITNNEPFLLKFDVSIEGRLEPIKISPDSKKLLFLASQKDETDDLWVVPVSLNEGRSTGPASKVFSGFEKEDMDYIYEINWLIDGTKLAICNKGNIWITSTERENPIKITKTQEKCYSPSWSPDGKWISYNSDGFVKTRPEGTMWEVDFEEMLDKLLD